MLGKRITQILLGLFSVCMSASGFSLPFNVVTKAGTTLPTQISSGQTVTAFYTVTNNTGSTRNSNFVKYLPPNVSQVTSDASVANLCGSTFNLGPSGSSNSSCTLELNISGPVNGSDPDQHHHLFVCMPGGTTCAGTPDSLNVTLISQAQYAYFTNSGNNTITICPINNFNACVTVTDPTFNGPRNIVINSSGTFAYIHNITPHPNTISICPLNSNGTLGTCSVQSGSAFTGSAINVTPQNLYILNSTNLPITISVCLINADGSIGSCSVTPTPGVVFNNPSGIVFSANHSIAYISDIISQSVTICTVGANGLFTSCSDSGITFSAPVGLSVSANGNTLYIVNNKPSPRVETVNNCSINADGTLGVCTTNSGNGTFSFPTGLHGQVASFAASNGVLYVPNAGNNTASACPINSDGTLGTCTVITNSGFNAPTSAFVVALGGIRKRI